MNVNFGIWDVLLVVVVAGMSTALAYVHNPKMKALILNLPIPFSMSNLSLGHKIDATNVIGLIVLFIFTHGVRILHKNLKLPIVPSIVLSATGYCLIGWGIARVLPSNNLTFWLSVAVVAVFGIVSYKFSKAAEEPGHRSPLPVPVKLAIVTAVISFIVMIKNLLQGFMTLFPMVGVVAAYEARHSLQTICRQIPILILTMLPMMVVMKFSQALTGIGISLIIGWVVFIAVLFPFARNIWQKI